MRWHGLRGSIPGAACRPRASAATGSPTLYPVLLRSSAAKIIATARRSLTHRAAEQGHVQQVAGCEPLRAKAHSKGPSRSERVAREALDVPRVAEPESSRAGGAFGPCRRCRHRTAQREYGERRAAPAKPCPGRQGRPPTPRLGVFLSIGQHRTVCVLRHRSATSSCHTSCTRSDCRRRSSLR